MSDVKISDERLKKLKAIENLTKLCENMKELKRAAYEEKNIDNIVKFIEKQV